MEARHEQRAVASLPPFLPASMRLLEVLSREDAVVEQVAELMRLDPEFVDEILRMANSPAFGFETPVRNLGEAIILLGTRRVKALIATIALKKSLAGGALEGFWRHSVASAFVAAELASGCGVHPDHAYTAALLHDLRTWAALSGCAGTDHWRVPNGCKELVGWACRISDALGFGVAASHRQAETHAADLPDAVRSRIDGRVLAALVREKVKAISN